MGTAFNRYKYNIIKNRNKLIKKVFFVFGLSSDSFIFCSKK